MDNKSTAAAADREADRDAERKALLARLGYIPFSDVCIILNVEESTGRNRKSQRLLPGA